MKLFGEFLVEKNILSEEQLLELLMQQLRDLPTVGEVVFREKLLSTRDILRTMAHQTRQGIEFRTAARELGLWNDSIEKQVAEFSARKRMYLGQLVVNCGRATLPQMEALLDEYLVSVQQERKAQEAPPNPAKAKPVEVSPPTATSAVSDQGEPTFFGSFVDAGKLKEVEAAVSALRSEQDPKRRIELLDTLSHLFIEFRGAARFAELVDIEKLAGSYVGLVSAVQRSGQEFPESEMDYLATLGLEAVALIGKLRGGPATIESAGNREAVAKICASMEQLVKLMASEAPLQKGMI